MKIVNYDSKELIIYLNNLYSKEIELESNSYLEEYFKELFLKLKNYYLIKIEGFYIVNVYVDKKYGTVVELIKEELPYIDYFEDQIDMKIKVQNNCDFLYKIDDPLELPKKYKKNKIYKYQNIYYLKLEETLNNIEIGELLEYTECIYKPNNKIIARNNNLIKIN